MRTTIYVGGEQDGSFILNDKQIESLGKVLRGYATHEKIGNDDKVESILATDKEVILQTTNGIEILSHLTDDAIDTPLYSSINVESGEMQTYRSYIEAYEWQFYEERDGITATLDKVITLLTEIKNDLNK